MAGKKQILVTEDDFAFRSVLRCILGTRYDVTLANNGEQAWTLIQNKPFDLLVTDWQMPRINGLTLCRLIRSRPEIQQLPIILVSARGFDFDYDEVVREICPCKNFVKPFSPTQLLKAVNEVLGCEGHATTADCSNSRDGGK